MLCGFGFGSLLEFQSRVKKCHKKKIPPGVIYRFNKTQIVGLFVILAKEKHLVTTESQLGTEAHCVANNLLIR